MLTTVEKVAGYARKSSVWPATFGLACCAIELFQADGPRRPGPVRHGTRLSHTRQADLMIVAGRVSQKMAPLLQRIYKIQNMKLGANRDAEITELEQADCEGCHLRSRSAASE